MPGNALQSTRKGTRIYRGDLLISSQNDLGPAKAIADGPNNTIVLEYFDSPAQEPTRRHREAVPRMALERYPLSTETRVFWPTPQGWRSGRVLYTTLQREICIRGYEWEGFVPEAELYIRWHRPLTDPVGFAAAGLLESPLLADRRRPFLQGILAQRAAARGMGSLLSSSIELHEHQIEIARRVLGDPLLHTHVVVANLARGPDGRWTALDGRALYAHAKTAGYLYQAVLRQELTVRLGVEWHPVTNGTADLVGIPRPLLELFSKRRRQILQRLAERGEHSAKAARAAALDTRHAKAKAKQASVAQQTLRDRWAAEAAQHGFDVGELRHVLGRVRQRPVPVKAERLLTELAGPTGLTAHASTFTRRVIQAICDRLPAGAHVAAIEALADRLLAAKELVCELAWRPGRTGGEGDVIRRNDGRIVPALAGQRRFSTHELLAVEAKVIAGALRRQGEGRAVVPAATVTAALAATPELSVEQVAMVWALTTSGDGVQTVHAKAGAGKTFALATARQAWQTAGYRVLGAALSAQAARVLADGTGIQATTLARLLFQLDQPGWSRLVEQASTPAVVRDLAGG